MKIPIAINAKFRKSGISVVFISDIVAIINIQKPTPISESPYF